MPLEVGELTKLLEARIREQVRAKPENAARLRTFGLDPLPARTDLNATKVSEQAGDDFVIEQWTYESRPGVVVPATLIVPDHGGSSPVIVVAADAWPEGRRAACLQAFGIAMSLRGFATLLIEGPGVADREAMGDRSDPGLSRGVPAVGQYAWDLVRAVDLVGRSTRFLAERVALVGIGEGGEAALIAALAEPKFVALAVVDAGESQEVALGAAYRSSAGSALTGDWANLIGDRIPMPLFFLGVESETSHRIEGTTKKLQPRYRSANAENALRWEYFLGERDFNRRMRESVAAFLVEHVNGGVRRAYLPELRPLTDGRAVPAVAGTVPPESLVLTVESKTLQDIGEDALLHPYPEQVPELVAWGKYGRVQKLEARNTLRLADSELPKLDPALLVPLGLSAPDLFAQIFHLSFPGGPEGWEPLGLSGDALTAMIASVRTLVKGAEPQVPLEHVEAVGPVSSLVARLHQEFRPALTISITDHAETWGDCVAQGVVIPGARYRRPLPPLPVAAEPVAIEELTAEEPSIEGPHESEIHALPEPEDIPAALPEGGEENVFFDASHVIDDENHDGDKLA